MSAKRARGAGGFAVGTRVWAKVKGHPHWPALVIDTKDAPSDVRSQAHSSSQTLVRFFGDPVSYSWLDDKDIQDFLSKKAENSDTSSIKLSRAIQLAEKYKEAKKAQPRTPKASKQTKSAPATVEKISRRRKSTSDLDSSPAKPATHKPTAATPPPPQSFLKQKFIVATAAMDRPHRRGSAQKSGSLRKSKFPPAVPPEKRNKTARRRPPRRRTRPDQANESEPDSASESGQSQESDSESGSQQESEEDAAEVSASSSDSSSSSSPSKQEDVVDSSTPPAAQFEEHDSPKASKKQDEEHDGKEPAAHAEDAMVVDSAATETIIDNSTVTDKQDEVASSPVATPQKRRSSRLKRKADQIEPDPTPTPTDVDAATATTATSPKRTKTDESHAEQEETAPDVPKHDLAEPMDVVKDEESNVSNPTVEPPVASIEPEPPAAATGQQPSAPEVLEAKPDPKSIQQALKEIMGPNYIAPTHEESEDATVRLIDATISSCITALINNNLSEAILSLHKFEVSSPAQPTSSSPSSSSDALACPTLEQLDLSQLPRFVNYNRFHPNTEIAQLCSRLYERYMRQFDEERDRVRRQSLSAPVVETAELNFPQRHCNFVNTRTTTEIIRTESENSEYQKITRPMDTSPPPFDVDAEDDDLFEHPPAAKRTKLVEIDSSADDLLQGDDPYGKYLRSLYLKKIIRENHGHEIGSICFNPISPFVSNLLASVGGCQANIYDNANCGSHLDLIENYVHRDGPFFVQLSQADPLLAPAPLGKPDSATPMPPPAPKLKKGQIKKSNQGNLQQPWDFASPDNPRRELWCQAWIRGPSVSARLAGRDTQQDDDLFEESWLGVAGADQLVHLLSVSRCKIVSMLFGCQAPIAVLAADPAGRRIAAITRNSQLCVWELDNLIDFISRPEYDPPQTVEALLAIPGALPVIDVDVPEGIICAIWLDTVGLLMGSRSGIVYVIPTSLTHAPSLTNPPRMATVQTPHKGSLGDLEFMMVYPSDKDASSSSSSIRIVSKSCDGRIFVWQCPCAEEMNVWADKEAEKVHHVSLANGIVDNLRIPNCFAGSQGAKATPFDVTPDGKYIAVGNAKGQVYIYDLLKGTRCALLEHKRSSHPITAVAFAKPSCQNVLFSSQTFIWRYDYIDAAEIQALREQNGIAAPAAEKSVV